MRVLIQWALRTPADWEEIDPHVNPAAWTALPKKARPSGVQTPNMQRGWINALNCMGMIFEWDVYAVEPITIDGEQAVRISGWNDQSEPGREQAAVWTLLPQAPDPEHGGAMNPRGSVVFYLSPTLMAEAQANPFGLAPNVTIRPWTAFVPPPEALRRYGVLLTDALFQQHRQRRALRGWQDWTP